MLDKLVPGKMCEKKAVLNLLLICCSNSGTGITDKPGSNV